MISVEQLIQVWLHGVSRRSQMGYTIGIIFFMLWEIWKHMCKLKYEGRICNPQSIIEATLSHIQFMNSYMVPKHQPTIWEGTMMQILGVNVNNVGFVEASG